MKSPNNKKIIFIHLLNDFSGSTKVLSEVVEACELHQIDNDLYINYSGDGFLYNKAKNQYFFHYNRHENKFFASFFTN